MLTHSVQYNWKRLYADTVPANKEYAAGTVPAHKKYVAGTVPANKKYAAGTVPANKKYAAAGTLSNDGRCWLAMPLGAGVLSWVAEFLQVGILGSRIPDIFW